MGENAEDVDGHEEEKSYFSCDQRSGGVRSMSFSFNDDDSFFELSVSSVPRTENAKFAFQTGVVRPTMEEFFFGEEVAQAADKLSVDGTVVPLEKLDNDSLPEKSTGGRDAGERIDNEVGKSDVRRPATLFTRQEIGHRRDKENRQIIVATRKNNSLPSAAFQSAYMRNIIKIQVQRFRSAFKPEAKANGVGGEGKEEEPNTKSSASSQATTTRSSPVMRKLWVPICNWFTSFKPRKGGKHPKPKMVEISGQGTMIGVLKDITAGRMSSKGRRNSEGGEPKGRISKSAPTSPRRSSGSFPSVPPWGQRHADKDVSIDPAILHCKLSNLSKEI